MTACVPDIKTGRNLTVDAAKGIGILLVVFAHINYTFAPLTYIYSFHMPLFFILSGMLFRREKYATFPQFLKSRFHSLICPYLIFYGLSLPIKLVLTAAADGLSAVFSAEMLKAVLQMFLGCYPAASANNPLWFVPCLFCVEVLYFFISKTKRWLNVSICTVLVCAGWLIKSEYLPIRGLRLLWNFDVSLFAIGYYALGNLLSEKVLYLLSRWQMLPRKNLLSLCAALVCAAAVLPVSTVNGKISVGSGLYGNGFLLYATGIIGTLAVLFAAAALENCRFLRYLGQNTFPIMGTHYVIRNVFNAACVAVGLGIYDRESILASIIPFILVLSASIICTEIYNRTRTAIANKKNRT